MEQDERACPLGIARRVEARHPGTLVGAEHDGPLRAGVVEHGTEILHPRLERGEVRPVVGQPRATLVEEDQPERTREALVKLAPVRRLPGINQVGDVVGDVDEVVLAVTQDVVGDRDAPVAGVADVDFVGHGSGAYAEALDAELLRQRLRPRRNRAPQLVRLE